MAPQATTPTIGSALAQPWARDGTTPVLKFNFKLQLIQIIHYHNYHYNLCQGWPNLGSGLAGSVSGASPGHAGPALAVYWRAQTQGLPGLARACQVYASLGPGLLC